MVAKENDVEKIKEEREKQESSIKLSQRLREFMYWNRHEVGEEQSPFTKVKTSQPSEVSDGEDEVDAYRYDFKDNGKDYWILMYDKNYYTDYYDSISNDNSYDVLLEMHRPDRRVFATKMRYAFDEWSDWYVSRKLIAFIPGSWLDKTLEILADYEKTSEENKKKWEEDYKEKQREELKKNFTE